MGLRGGVAGGLTDDGGTCWVCALRFALWCVKYVMECVLGDRLCCGEKWVSEDY